MNDDNYDVSDSNDNNLGSIINCERPSNRKYQDFYQFILKQDDKSESNIKIDDYDTQNAQQVYQDSNA